jgi:hypothetical protein
MKRVITLIIGILLLTGSFLSLYSQTRTIALWPFDEQQGLYPSDVLNDVSNNNYPLVLGRGGMIVPGKFGNALEPFEQPTIKIPSKLPEGAIKFGITPLQKKAGQKVAPMNWKNAFFCALMTKGQNHLRKLVGFVNVTDTKLNLGNFNWTVEFWFELDKKIKNEGTVFEIGQGPRGENNKVTRLSLSSNLTEFILYNFPAGVKLNIPTELNELYSSKTKWHHLAFVYSAIDNQLKHYVDGVLQKLPAKAEIKSLAHGDLAYMSIGRDGEWRHPLQGKIDELRFSEGEVYKSDFTPPGSFSPLFDPELTEQSLKKGPPLLFSDPHNIEIPVELGNRKYLFFDNSLFHESNRITFNVNPPENVQKVFDVEGSYRKHLTVIQDSKGLIRIYNAVKDDHLEVMTSEDGIHFEKPVFETYKKNHNIVINEPVGTGQVFIDPNAPADQKWKYVSGYHDRGVYVYASPDGYHFKREKLSVLPFRTGSQTNIFYDDQRQIYASFFRTDMGTTPGGATERHHVMVETKNILSPWPFKPISQREQAEIAKHRRLHKLNPWYMDNGPLTPGGFGVEYPWIFGTIDSLDPVGTDMYIPKAIKYEGAPDSYFAFPEMYFHYETDGPETRQILGDSSMNRGSGPIEVQLEVSRDGIHWKRFPRPAYLPVGQYDDLNIKQIFIAEGLVDRGDEIWQYFFGDNAYHSEWSSVGRRRAVYRVVQRKDGFVSADAPYDRVATIITKPLVFKGDRIELNINTGATGYAQVGFLDENGRPVKGFSTEDCIYINGNFVSTDVEWMNTGKDVSLLQGKTVQVVIKMRGSKLYSMQFVKK